MKIAVSKICNEMNIRQLEKYFSVSSGTFLKFYSELSSDKLFIDELNDRKRQISLDYGFDKGLFGSGDFDCIDWYAFERILMYVLVRHFKPKNVLETGVYYGGNTVFILKALQANDEGQLISIDYPDSAIKEENSVLRHPEVGDTELYENKIKPGFLVPDNLKNRWQLLIGDSHKIIPSLNQKFDLYLHDSEHSFDFITKEIALAHSKLAPDGLIVVDDIDWSNGFYSYCSHHELYPLLLTDNGKDELRVRTGVIDLKHPKNKEKAYIGTKKATLL